MDNKNQKVKEELSESERIFLKKILAMYRKGCKSIINDALIKGNIQEMSLQIRCDNSIINLKKTRKGRTWE